LDLVLSENWPRFSERTLVKIGDVLEFALHHFDPEIVCRATSDRNGNVAHDVADHLPLDLKRMRLHSASLKPNHCRSSRDPAHVCPDSFFTKR
jgi:hypothetical protein